MGKETKVAVIDAESADAQEKKLAEAVTDAEFRAGAIIISNDEDYKNAGAFGRELKNRAAAVKDFWQPLKDAAYRAHSEICAKERAMLAPLTTAEKILRQTMGAYITERERQKAAMEEAAKRALQKEVEKKLQEAIGFEAKGDAAAAAGAVEEAEIMDNMTDTVAAEVKKPKMKGVSTRKDWEIVSIDSRMVPINVAGVEIRPVDTAAVMRIIRAHKGTVSIAGVTYKEVAKIAFRR